MAKGSTNYIGLMTEWRSWGNCDTYRIGVGKGNSKLWISAKVQPTLAQLNQYLKVQKLRKDDALLDSHVQALISRLQSELASSHGLKEYKARERILLDRKRFNYEASLEAFFKYKSNTSLPMSYVSLMKRIWLPFFFEKKADHPREWKRWRKQAEIHMRTLKKENSVELYSLESQVRIASALNQYLEYLAWNEDITEADKFMLKIGITIEQKKRSKSRRPRPTYSFEEIVEIKELIDKKYQGDLKVKLRAYGMLLGICTGLRKGNILGLKARNLHPDAEVPYFETEDNIVAGWGRGEKGNVTLRHSTKTIVGTVKLPFLQPSVEFACQVARFLKSHLRDEDPILKCSSHTVGRWWDQIAGECRFRALNPHAWRHSYATNGAAHLHDFYKGNPYFLQLCCTHEDFDTTQKYIDQSGDAFLRAFLKAKPIT